jgi:hypothetical protein
MYSNMHLAKLNILEYYQEVYVFSTLLTIFAFVGFGVLTAVSTKMAVFWVVEPCSQVEVYQRFRGPCCLHHQGDIATTQKTAI